METPSKGPTPHEEKPPTQLRPKFTANGASHALAGPTLFQLSITLSAGRIRRPQQAMQRIPNSISTLRNRRIPTKKTESAIKLIHFFDVGRPTGKKFRHCDDSIFRPAARVNFAGDVSIKLGPSSGRVGWRFGWKKRTGDELTKVDSFDGSKV